jgi:8-oxo-dGTP diphosphatase
MKMKHYTVVAAIIKHKGKILCVQRNTSKYEYISNKWEFPGGKVEVGETREDAIIREIREELNITITVESEFITVDHVYPDFSLLMHSFICIAEDPYIFLFEHIDFKWLNIAELNLLDWAAADLPIVEKLQIL